MDRIHTASVNHILSHLTRHRRRKRFCQPLMTQTQAMSGMRTTTTTPFHNLRRSREGGNRADGGDDNSSRELHFLGSILGEDNNRFGFVCPAKDSASCFFSLQNDTSKYNRSSRRQQNKGSTEKRLPLTFVIMNCVVLRGARRAWLSFSDTSRDVTPKDKIFLIGNLIRYPKFDTLLRAFNERGKASICRNFIG